MGFRVDNGQVATLHLQRFAKDCQYTLAKIPLFLHSCSPSAELGGLYRSWYNHSSSFTIASVRIENHLRSWRRHQVLASWQSSQLNLVLPQSSCSTLVKISGRMLLVRLPGNPPNTPPPKAKLWVLLNSWNEPSHADSSSKYTLMQLRNKKKHTYTYLKTLIK